MPQSPVSLHVHIVFSAKHREPSVDAELASRLYPYIGGIVRNTESALIAIGGIADHVHLLVSLGRQISVADVVRNLKSNSSAWVHKSLPDRSQFAWQSGYGAFAVSRSVLERVKAYIADQEQHHRNQSFQDEFRNLLRKHGIEWDERYVWD
jgi:REP element-mobilizing transposase RayT